MFVFKYFFKYPYHAIATKEAREFLWLLWKYGTEKRYKPREIHFQGYTFTVPDCLSFLFQIEEIFVQKSYEFKAESVNPVIYDCGSNVGTSCIYFKQLFPKATIKAFEADIDIAKILKINLNKNNCTDIQIINKAVWINDEGIEFVIEGSDSASIYGVGEKKKVESIRLRDYILSESRIDMLKMDIEGAEVEVIKDCKDVLNNIQNIFIEYHSFIGKAQDLHEILQILTKNDFRYFIRDAQDRQSPLINRQYKDNNVMDLQLNIHAYRIN